MTFFDRYAKCCQERDISPMSQAAAEQLGCTKANISAFAKKGTTPKGEVVAGAARMLDISADYLLGLIDEPLPIKAQDTLYMAEKEAVTMLRSLNTEGQEAAIAMLTGLQSQPIYKKCTSSELDQAKLA